MSAAAISAPRDDARPSLPTLTRVELRKMTDTRAGRWLLGIVGLLIVATTIIYAFAAEAADKTWGDFFMILQLPTGVILPVLGILLVTSEWSQRTALTTFTLVPDRTRVVAAKAIAVLVLTVLALVASLVMSAIGVLLAGSEGDFALGGTVLGQVAVAQLIGFLVGLAFGLAFQSSAPAIVLYFVLPTILGIIGELITGIRDTIRWLDFNAASGNLIDTAAASGTEWGRVGTSTLVWLGIPLAFGLYRLWKGEIK